ncbi:hypothetical protein BKA61DRAFT_637486 [Leptodontidium sp. MPI-SDFR-AT-0119]|nr:hypothetical protein BKA61DRAFT_637486 [Leptodontidium sp. MPI-SDFR-AT-0119]
MVAVDHVLDRCEEALVCIDSAEDQPVPKPLVKTMIAAMSGDLKTIAETVQSTAIKVQPSQETNQAVKEAAETQRITTGLLQETNDIAKAINDTTKTTNDMVKVIIDTTTIESLRAKNPRNLQSHVDRAIEQSRNKHIERIRVTLNRNDFDEIKAELLHDNRPFIPNADIKYIGWHSFY